MAKQGNLLSKTLVIGIIFLFVVMSLTPSVAVDTIKKSSMPIFKGKTLYVGGTGEGNYTRIQDAIDDADWGDTVFVYDDSSPYYENVEITNKPINLIGEDKNTTIIDGGGSSSVIRIYKNAFGVTISGFTIKNSGNDVFWNAGITIDSSFNIITGNIIRNNAGSGILNLWINYDYGDTITQNIIMYNTWGITLDCSSKNDIYENYVAYNSVGIYDGSSTLIVGDMFSPLSWKSLFLDEYRNNISGNIVKNNIQGILLEPSWHTYIFNNDIIKNSCGISLSPPIHTSCNENYIYQNNIRNNILGIRISGRSSGGFYQESKDNEIHHNNFINNRRNAHFNGNNKWDANYWDNWIGVRIKLPIFQRFPKILFSFFKYNFDWHPAKEPYDIEVVI